MEYKIERIDNQLLCQMYLHLVIFNNDSVNTLYLPSIPLIFDFSTLIRTGTQIGTKHEGELIRIHNELQINQDDKTLNRALRGLVTNGNFITIAPNTSQEFFVEIPTQLSDNFILSQLVTDDIKLRIQFLKNVSQPVVAGNYVPNGTPLVQDINIYFQVANIYQHFIRTDTTQTVSLLKQPFIDYPYVKAQ